jgi:hypothetical protein
MAGGFWAKIRNRSIMTLTVKQNGRKTKRVKNARVTTKRRMPMIRATRKRR